MGSVRNAGIEVNLNTVNVKTKNFTWSTTFIFAANKNKILKLNDNNADIFPGPNFLGQTNILRVGEPIGSFYGMTRLGTYSNSKEAAWKQQNIIFCPATGNIFIMQMEAIIIALSAILTPKWTGTFSSTMNYKDWDFSFDIRFVQGVNTAATFKHSSEDRQTIANSLATVLKCMDSGKSKHHDFAGS